jgi:hypothetical protein
MTAKELFTSKDAYATPMFLWMLQKYGTDIIHWDPATIELQLREDLGEAVPGYNLDKINAACSLLASNLFHTSLETFNNLCLAFSRGVVSGEYMIPARSFDILWGVTEAKIIEGPDFDKEGFDPNIALYAGVTLDHEGIYEPIKMLHWITYPEGRKETVYNAIADDPLSYETYKSMQQDKKDQLNQDVQKKMIEMFKQVRDLHIPGANQQYLDHVLKSIQG